VTGIIGDGFWNASLDSGGVANVHGVFRLVPAVLLLPFAGFFASLAERIVPDRQTENEDAAIEEQVRQLDSRLITSPALAFDQVDAAICNMADLSIHNFNAAVELFENYDPKRKKRLQEREDLLDRLADTTNQYVVDISPYLTDEKDSIYQGFLLKALSSFERIGDHAMNLLTAMENLRSNNGDLSEKARAEFHVAVEAVREILSITRQAFDGKDSDQADQVEPLEEVIDSMIEALKTHHIRRMTRGECDVYTGIQYENMLNSLERISDQCSDLAVFIISMNDTSIIGQEHQYIHNLHHSNNQKYLDLFHKNHDHYFGELKRVRESFEGGESGQGKGKGGDTGLSGKQEGDPEDAFSPATA